MDVATLVIVVLVVLAIGSLVVGATFGVPGVVKELPPPRATPVLVNGETPTGPPQPGGYGATRGLAPRGRPDGRPGMQFLAMVGAAALALIVLVVAAVVIWQPSGLSFAGNRPVRDSADSGARLYTMECARCHGPSGAGQIGPNLHLNELAARNKWNPNDAADLAKLRDLVTNTITNGRPQTLMPPWGREQGGPLTATQILNLTDLILTDNWGAVVPAPSPVAVATAVPVAGSPPVNGDAKALITKYGCGGCHTIAGIPGAFGSVGPNLSHEGTVPKVPVTSRNLDNTPENMAAWVHDAPSIKPGVVMPNFSAAGMSDAEAKVIADYLETLK